MSRTVVMRREMDSTSPKTPLPKSMVSPMPYWSSMSMKMPERKSLTRAWAPKPKATPTTPADATSGATLTPSLSRMASAAQTHTKMATADRPTPARVWMREVRRASWVRARALSVSLCCLRGVSGEVRRPCLMLLSASFVMSRRSNQLPMTAMNRMRRMPSGLATTHDRTVSSCHHRERLSAAVVVSAAA